MITEADRVFIEQRLRYRRFLELELDENTNQNLARMLSVDEDEIGEIDKELKLPEILKRQAL